MMKRKNEEEDVPSSNGHSHKKPATTSSSSTEVHSHFRPDLFSSETISSYASSYAESGPYKHAVVSDLINSSLLRAVRSEIRDNIHFTPKETDIYKIHQSGDLANLSGLPASALSRLPSLLKLRDAMYSSEFRDWISSVSNSGPLSGIKTDMAVNVYVPGCHLLCHDDVIGSRRVSYILYLNDPDIPWKPEWGGALRLYPTDEVVDKAGKRFKLPKSEWSKSIPPAWNQLSFFAVQPGESFHDVEEVYKRTAEEGEGDDGGRIRMAISGWFHIPQEGEDGYEAGLEEKLAEKSSLQQLQGNADEFDEPQQDFRNIELTSDDAAEDDEESTLLTEADLQFLLQFMTPNYLTPDTVEELNELFTDESILQLSNFLNNKFAPALKSELLASPESKHDFKTSRPPHKHHYHYLQPAPTSSEDKENAPFKRVLDELLPSTAFAKWLALVTGLKVTSASVIARRFQRGVDYQLAQGYEGEEPQLEYTLCVTPTTGWGGEEEEGGDEDEENHDTAASDGKANAKATTTSAKKDATNENDDDDNIGGYELYMAGDDLADGSDDGASEDGAVPVPSSSSSKIQSQTGAGDRRSAKSKSQRKAADPAVYQAARDDEDDGILFSNAAAWNTMSIVLRDRGTLKFVKYVSRAAPGDRFDYTGCVKVEFEEEEEDE